MKMLVKIMNVIHIVILDGWKRIYMKNGLLNGVNRFYVD